MEKTPKIKVNSEGMKAIQELATLANKGANGDLQTSQGILQFLGFIEVDEKYFSDLEKEEQKKIQDEKDFIEKSQKK